MNKFNYLKSQNADYIEELFAQYTADPNSVDESWRYFFEGIELGTSVSEEERANGHTNGHANGNGHTNGHTSNVVEFTSASAAPSTVQTGSAVNSEAKVGELIQTYREVGRLLANINPLAPAAPSHPLLELKNFDLSETDLDRKFTAAKLIGLPAPSTLREILARLRETYCGTIGVEFTHIQDASSRDWLQERMETSRNKANLSVETKTRILRKLTEAEGFERFLHTRFVAQKRFSVEGGDALIPMLDILALEAAEHGAKDLVLGMAHRGRLNVLSNIFGKKYEDIFTEFQGIYAVDGIDGEGDVKYHMGYSADVKTPTGKTIHLSLASNPSHLEFVNPVVEGVARAKQRLRGDNERTTVVPVLIHGDAAFAGQGVVYETLQFMLLRGYATGGTIHVVTNNQVGFTTLPIDSRSTTYATDLAKMLETPIFHVNGDDAEALAYVTQLAIQFRQRYHRDVVIDLVCYRKYGHNEGDEPSFTQPLMYKQIKDHPSPREIYAKRLANEGTLSESDAQKMVDELGARLQAALETSKTKSTPPYLSVFEGQWKGLRRATDEDIWTPVKTSVDEKTLKEIGKKIGSVKPGFTPHSKLVRLLEQRGKMVEDGTSIDWGTGEALAFGSLLVEGTHVRVSGQDSERGTFSHRHSVLYDFETGETYTPLNNLKTGQPPYEVYNSHLSEAGVLGFEYGYALADPNALTIWEAQFGDFGNGAQVIIDQFIASSESKWQRMCGLVMLLPHGYEGQGPEHSSARLERFLQLCAKNNMQVGNFTTPAQIFHALRRQVKRKFRKPLIVMSPKSLLRHPNAVSPLSDFTNGSFQEVLDDTLEVKKAKKLIFCTGKIFYELADAREKAGRNDIAVVRIEQLYPFPTVQVQKMLKKYSSATEVLWVQEEPRNMGAWNCMRDFIPDLLASSQKLTYVGRIAGAAPAVGSSKVHEKEQKSILEEALK